MSIRGNKQAGFTLLELIGVIGVIGILLAIGFFFFTQAREASRLREAQSQFTQVLERARNLARRYSRAYQLDIAAFQNNAVAYTTTPRATQRNTTTGVLEYVPVANNPPPSDQGVFTAGVKITPIGATPAPPLVFLGPFGRLDGPEVTTYCLTLASSVTKPWTEVSVLGVTGKVVSRGIQQGRTDCP